MIKLKSLLTEKTLYHGTTVANLKSIERSGLVPSVGKFVAVSYDDAVEAGLAKELIFATDKQQLDKAVSAATAQIADQMGKYFHDVTDDEFYRRAAIIKIYDGESLFQQRPEGDERDEHPYTVEPGDYYSEDYIIPDEILTGQRMIRLLKRYGVWPRAYMFSRGENPLRGELMRLALKYHKNIPKEKIKQAIMNLPAGQLLDKIKVYRKATGQRETWQ
jgi:hypothetical protein